MLVKIKIIWQKKPKKATLFGTWHVLTTPEKLGEIRKIGDAKKVLQYLSSNKLVNEDKKEVKLKAPTVTIDLSESYAQISRENKNGQKNY